MNTYPSHKNAPLQILSDFNFHIYIFIQVNEFSGSKPHMEIRSLFTGTFWPSQYNSLCVYTKTNPASGMSVISQMISAPTVERDQQFTSHKH